MKKPIICVDFDGVLHSYTSGWKGMGRIDGPPVDGAVVWLMDLLAAGFRVAIYSSRSKSLRERWAMKRWLRRHWPYNDFNRIEWPWFKPPALITVDDRAWRFEGAFPTALQLRNFKPWNKPPIQPNPFGEGAAP